MLILCCICVYFLLCRAFLSGLLAVFPSKSAMHILCAVVYTCPRFLSILCSANIGSAWYLLCLPAIKPASLFWYQRSDSPRVVFRPSLKSTQTIRQYWRCGSISALYSMRSCCPPLTLSLSLFFSRYGELENGQELIGPHLFTPHP